MSRIDKIICLAATLLLIAGCNKDNIGTVYSGNSGFAFAAGVLYAEVSDDDKGTLEIPIYRGISGSTQQASIKFQYDASPSGSSTPEWKDADPAGIFSLTSSKATFAENSCESKVHVRFGDIAKLKVSEKYRFKLDIVEGSSPALRNSVVVTVSKKLIFEKYGDCSWFDECIFEKAYDTEIYKAVGEDIYRVLDPYSEGLVAEEYAALGWMGQTPDYVEFTVTGDKITFSEFPTGMLVNAKYMAYAYYPGDYIWGRDFSKYNDKCKKLSDKHFQLYAVYCLPEFQYGYLNDGIYKIDIEVK